MPTKVEGVGGRVTISTTGENRRPRGLALHNHGCVVEEEDRQGGIVVVMWVCG